MKNQTEETALKLEIKKYLKLTGWFVFHIRQGKHCYKGISDWIGIKDGVVVFIELKTPVGKESMAQMLFREDVTEHGGNYWVIRSLENAISLNKFVNEAVY